jgi:hypothetical protein
MANEATILIPDISGYTGFITKTELGHGAHAINILLESIIEAVGEEYEVAEIEGDAVLLYQKVSKPSRKDIMATCMKIFNAFHYKRKWMQQHTVCPCGACQAIIDLSLKFVAHHGPLAELKVGRFTKPSGPDMIVAHRLLKNSINSNEYVLITECICGQDEDENGGHAGLQWQTASDEFASIGKVDYRYALLEEAKKEVPDPPELEAYALCDTSFYVNIPIAAHYRDAYMVVMNIPGRPEWVPGLLSAEQDAPFVFIGSVHRCRFEGYNATISPLALTIADDGIMFTEKRQLENGLSLIYEYAFKAVDEDNCVFAASIMPGYNQLIPVGLANMLQVDLQAMADKLKMEAEAILESSFEPMHIGDT